MQDYELPASFYLGRTIDPASGQTSAAPLLYDSADLVTHGLCVGMTGSGKTGLGIALIEEAILDGVPVIVIDPKGDMGNLLLTFPGLQGSDFEPWIQPDDAQRAGQSSTDYAAAQAQQWQDGLAAWAQDGARIKRLRDSAEISLYTPGSTAGQPVSLLRSFEQPDTDDPELRNERAQTVVSGLLGLAGIEADPVKSPQHILLSLILLSAWEAGESPDLAALIHRIQQPPFTRVGVMELDGFFPPKDRFAFALALNSLIAAPGFSVWTQGAALDIASMLRSAAGRPRVAIFSISHLDDAQRMFFVSLLLGAVVGWMRGQSGTTSLRAMLYMDEIFGFFPPVANPPSKPPLLTLLKQGRAFGLGVVLATQNPVDLDYKGLGNIGTWWLGRLQTERDKARLLDGLEGVAAGSFDRAAVDKTLSGLRKRCFLMRNVHDKDLALFETRWVMSYLRGPLGRAEIRRLDSMQPVDTGQAPPAATPPAVPIIRTADAATASTPPILPPDVPVHYSPADAGSALEAVLYADVELRYTDSKLKLDHVASARYIVPLPASSALVDWLAAERVDLGPATLRTDAPVGCSFSQLPAAASRKSSYTKWSSELARHLREHEALELLHDTRSGLVSQPQESERSFRVRLEQLLREDRTDGLERLRARYAPKQAALDDRLRRARQAVEREQQEARGQQFQSAISLGTTLVGALLGRKKLSKSNLGKAASAARSASRTMKQRGDVDRAQETVAAVEEQIRALDLELQEETARLAHPADAITARLERVKLLPKRSNVQVGLLTLLWILAQARE